MQEYKKICKKNLLFENYLLQLNTRQEMEMFQSLRQGDTPAHEKAPLGNNLRPRQPLNNRAIRTNIALQKQKVLKNV